MKIKNNWALITKIFIVSTLFLGFAAQQDNGQWGEVEIDAAISKDTVFARLANEKEVEPFAFKRWVERDSLFKRTSDVAYFSAIPKYYDEESLFRQSWSKYNNCKAYFWHSDTLNIIIENNDGLTSHGFGVLYKNNKFFIKTFETSDVAPPPTYTPPAPKIKTIFQKLILNNASYHNGDSLYGYVDFKIEDSTFGYLITARGRGFFRAKIK